MGGGLNFGVGPATAAGIVLAPGASHFFGMQIRPLVGFHFRFLDVIGASFDFGPSFYFITSSTVITGFDMKQFGSLFGLSVHYFF